MDVTLSSNLISYAKVYLIELFNFESILIFSNLVRNLQDRMPFLYLDNLEPYESLLLHHWAETQVSLALYFVLFHFTRSIMIKNEQEVSRNFLTGPKLRK